MADKLTWSDRLRIERVVWMLDQRLYDIPRESRIAHRREVRLNLLSAAQDIGTRAAQADQRDPTRTPATNTDRGGRYPHPAHECRRLYGASRHTGRR